MNEDCKGFYTRHVLHTSCTLSHLVLATARQGRISVDTHSIDEKAEACKGPVAFPRKCL